MIGFPSAGLWKIYTESAGTGKGLIEFCGILFLSQIIYKPLWTGYYRKTCGLHEPIKNFVFIGDSPF
jgi:hypothetical protein